MKREQMNKNSNSIFGFNKRIAYGIFGIVGSLIIASIFWDLLIVSNDAGHVKIKQSLGTGNLSCIQKPGWSWKGGATITDYEFAETYVFVLNPDKFEQGTGMHVGTSLPTRFNDGAKAQVSGQLTVILPYQDCEAMIKIHNTYRSMDNLMRSLVVSATRKSLFNTGPFMSASESFAEKRPEYASLAEDQLVNGMIQTSKKIEKKKDPITGEEIEVVVLKKTICNKGPNCVEGYIRDISSMRKFGLSITDFVVSAIEYPRQVLEQIESQRKRTMNVLTKRAEAAESQARATAAEANALAAVAETRATEEVKKTTRIVAAEAQKEEAVLKSKQKEEVAKHDLEAAKLEAEAIKVRTTAQANARKALMLADGALSQKLAVLKEINKFWANAYTKQPPTPKIVVGSSFAKETNNPANVMMHSLSLNAMNKLLSKMDTQK